MDMMATVSTAITSTPSSTSERLAARWVSGGPPRVPNRSSTTSTTVWMAMPPRMLPTATPRSPLQAAFPVMANSGRLVVIASKMTPPSTRPKPSRVESTSVMSESLTPAY